nr:hypothetical protein [Tanacetum cinerariifolium]
TNSAKLKTALRFVLGCVLTQKCYGLILRFAIEDLAFCYRRFLRFAIEDLAFCYRRFLRFAKEDLTFCYKRFLRFAIQDPAFCIDNTALRHLAIHLILTGIGDEIYSTVDACQTAQEMWEAIERNQRTVNVVRARENVGSPVVQQSRIQCFNCREFGHFSKECRKPKRVKDSAYHKEKMLLCKQAEQGTDSEPVEQVQNDAGYNVFSNYLQHYKQSKSISNTCLVETNDSYVTPDSPDMCEDAIQNDQNDAESDDERAAVANLIANLKLNVDENKKIKKKLKKANTTLA